MNAVSWDILETPNKLLPRSTRAYLTRFLLHSWKNQEDGIHVVLDESGLIAVAELVEERTAHSGEGTKVLVVINLSGVTAVKRQPSVDPIRRIKKLVKNSGLQVAFVNCEDPVKAWIQELLDPFVLRPLPDTLPSAVVVATVPGNQTSDKWTSRLAKHIQTVIAAEDEFIRSEVAKCYHSFVDLKSTNGRWVPEVQNKMGKLRSTPIWCSGYFDANIVLGDPKVFPWVVVRMAEKISDIIDADHSTETNQNADYRLLACTRNGSVLAAAIRSVLVDDISVDVMERLGPSSHPIEDYHDDAGSQGTKFQYIFVADFVIGGTEVKLAELHAFYRKIPLVGAVAIGTVMPLDTPMRNMKGETASRMKDVQVEALVSLSEVCPNLSYSFP